MSTANCTRRIRLSPFSTWSTSFPGFMAARTILDNLALACIDCNLHKGTNLTGIDPESRQVTELFHPRRHRWEDHFEWRGIYLTGKTAIGRTTVRVLKMNCEDQLALRSS